jgi:hypothetical protein
MFAFSVFGDGAGLSPESVPAEWCGCDCNWSIACFLIIVDAARFTFLTGPFLIASEKLIAAPVVADFGLDDTHFGGLFDSGTGGFLITEEYLN